MGTSRRPSARPFGRAVPVRGFPTVWSEAPQKVGRSNDGRQRSGASLDWIFGVDTANLRAFDSSSKPARSCITINFVSKCKGLISPTVLLGVGVAILGFVSVLMG